MEPSNRDDDMNQTNMFNSEDIPFGPTPPIELSLSTAKTVILLGSLTQEGVTSKVHSFGYRYEQRILQSTPKNWLKIESFLKQLEDSNQIVAILIHLYEPVLLSFGDIEYRQVWTRILNIIKRHPSLIFIYQDNLLGDFTILEYKEKKFQEMLTLYGLHNMQDAISKLKESHEEWRLQTLEVIEWASIIIRDIQNSGVEIAPYKKNAEITIRIHDFLDEVDSGTFLRLYVPNGRYQANQFDHFLDMFESYLRNVEKRPFYIETRKTKHGVVYVFKNKEELAVIRELDDAIARFEDFMKMCQRSSADAEAILVNEGIQPIDASILVSKYRVEYQRIIMDIMKERDLRLMSLKYELQSSVFELVNNTVFSPNEIQSSSMLSIISPTHVTINITDNKIAQSIIEKQINGDIIYNEQDRELIKLFFDHLDKLSAERMKSELDQLKDESTPKETKQSSKQRIINFLAKLGTIAGEGIVRVLVAYLENLAKGSQP